MTAKLLVAAIAITLSGLVWAEECEQGVCNHKFGEWVVATTNGFSNAVTDSIPGGMLSYLCVADKPWCQWAVVMPEADCQPDSSVVVTIKGVGGGLLVDGVCARLPSMKDVPSNARVITLNGSNELLTPALTSRDISVSTINANGKTIQHKFSSEGAVEAIQKAHQAIKRIPDNAPSKNPEEPERQYGGWDIWRNSDWIEARTRAASGGVISYICPIGKKLCALGVHFPEADCDQKTKVRVSFVGDIGSMSGEANCMAPKKIAGRLMLIGDPSRDLLDTVLGKYVTISTRNHNQSFVQHRFETEGGLEAVAYTEMEQRKTAKNSSVTSQQLPRNPQ